MVSGTTSEGRQLDIRRSVRDRRQRVWLYLARKGNEDAFRRLYRELYRPVAAYIARRVPVVDDAEDITAVVFSRFVQRLESYDSAKGTVMTWVLTMARNTVIDHHRARRPEGADVADLADILAGQQPSPLDSLMREERLQRIRQCVARQPAEIREMFSLRFDQDLRIREVARIMGLSHDAAKQRFARSLRNIRHELQAETSLARGGRTCAMAD